MKYLKQHGIPVRGTGSNIKRRQGLEYGKRVVQRRELEHKRELENIAKMKTLRSQGFSYWKIADILNSLSVPTKTRRGKWHAKTVQAIMDRKEGNLSSSLISKVDK